MLSDKTKRKQFLKLGPKDEMSHSSPLLCCDITNILIARPQKGTRGQHVIVQSSLLLPTGPYSAQDTWTRGCRTQFHNPVGL
jgi:hypothetical protein